MTTRWTTPAALILALPFLGIVATTGCSSPLTDAQVTAEAQKRINADPRVQTRQIQLNSVQGTVTLTGPAASESERAAAAADVSQVEGVRVVVNNLKLVDTEIPAPAAAQPPAVEAATSRRPTPYKAVSTPPNPPPAQTAAEPVVIIAANNSVPDRHAIPSTGSSSATNAAPSSNPASSNSVSSNKDSSSFPTPPADPQIGSPAPPRPEEIIIPTGTALSVRLLEAVTSDMNQQGDSFLGSLASPLMVGDRVVIPAEAGIQGRVVSAKGSGHFIGRPSLVVDLKSVSYNGKTYQITTDQYSTQGASRDVRSAATIGGGAGVGAIIGGILGGGRGAGIGAIIGAATGTGVQAATKASQVQLPAESLLSFRLQTALRVNPSSTLTQAPNAAPGAVSDPFSDSDRPVLKRRPGSRAADPDPETTTPQEPIPAPQPN